MNRHVNAISGRLSLRAPQRDSLEILARVAEVIQLDKDADLNASLEAIRSEFPGVTDFEREFPSLCFALATGVGKTRLMGAFIAYLHLAAGIRHFFVMAPNLTIYNKLIRDFTPNTPKYVLQGIAEFAGNPPEIITGENYESGRGVRDELRQQPGLAGIAWQGKVHINIFNISKINSEVRGGVAPRMKRLSEYIGQSYFDYLAGLDDLVLLMDESHRYRASAGVRAINELKPILGLELTATPQVESGQRSTPFKNVIYSYPLSSALADGFIKEPAVVTRENFDKRNYSDEELERLKLEDGVRVHEDTKVELQTHALETGRPPVKPFMLVVAQDTEHAQAIVNRIRDDSFFEGRYKDKVITVHSNQRGEERDDTVERLLAVEDPNEATEIVVHVNMLKEGWDVTNLYTIVPLRAANSRTLVEQSIGRGLRLPYGRRVGVKAVDRLNIVAHDRFQEIIDEANKADSIIRTGIVIGCDIPLERKETVIVKPALAEAFGEPTVIVTDGAGKGAVPLLVSTPPATRVFASLAEQQIARMTVEAIGKHESLPRAADLARPEIQAELVRAVREKLGPTQMALAVGASEISGAIAPPPPDIETIVKTATELFIERGSMDVPRIIVTPAGEVSTGFEDFDLDTSQIHYQPVVQNILIHHLQSNDREQFHIYYRNDQKYEPDFIVETRQAKYLCEPKRASEMETQEVLDKARAAVIWCQQATEHARKHGDKPWSYLLIPHDAINANKSLGGLAASFTKQ